jgi:hypothetical protein
METSDERRSAKMRLGYLGPPEFADSRFLKKADEQKPPFLLDRSAPGNNPVIPAKSSLNNTCIAVITRV